MNESVNSNTQTIALSDNKDIEIRKARKEDAQDILNYLNIIGGESENLTFGENEFTTTLEQQEQIIESTQNTPSAMFVGYIDNELVCTGKIAVIDRPRISHHGEVGITVLKKFWGLGIGRCLMDEIINFVKSETQLEMITLKVKSDNVRAIKLYKKLGFQEIGCYPRFFKVDKVYFDAVVMSVVL